MTRRQIASLVVLSAAVFLVAVDGTVMAIAVPELTAELGPTYTQVLWIGDIYSFMLAGLLVTAGNLGDRLGRKRLLLFAAAGFGEYQPIDLGSDATARAAGLGTGLVSTATITHATPAEQEVMSRYVGWGQFPAAFNYADGDWHKEREQLRGLLSSEEWDAARKSTLNAHYTHPDVVKAHWQMAEKLGFTGGRYLETSAGIGYYLGMMPPHLAAHLGHMEHVHQDHAVEAFGQRAQRHLQQ